MSLINANEAICIVPTDQGVNFDFGLLCPYIEIAELKYLLPCLGKAFIDEIIADLNPAFYEAFKQAKAFRYTVNYIIGDYVTFNSKLYICTANTTSEIPTDVLFWSEVPKYSTAKFNNLWYSYLLRATTWAVMLTALPFIAIRITNSGLFKNFTDFSQSVNSADTTAIIKGLSSGLEVLMTALSAYLVENKTLFPTYPGNISCAENTCKRQYSGFAFSYIENDRDGCC